DGETADQMTGAVEAFGADEEQQVMVVTGAGGRAFCSGADLKAPGSLVSRPDTARTAPMGFAKLDPGKPVIAAIEGYCFAGGFEREGRDGIEALQDPKLGESIGAFAAGARPESPRPPS